MSMHQKRYHENFKRSTAREIFPHDITYRIANQLGRRAIVFVFLSWGACRRPCACGKRVCTAGGIFAHAAHNYSVQRAAD